MKSKSKPPVLAEGLDFSFYIFHYSGKSFVLKVALQMA